MEEKKILNEFAAKISKAKILHDHTYAQCHKLRQEAAQLQREYQSLVNQRQSAQIMESSLRSQLIMTKKANKEQTDSCGREVKQINELRHRKKDLKRDKDIAEHQLLKNTLELEQLVKERETLQNQAKILSEKLEGVTSEKDVLLFEFDKTKKAIRKYNNGISELKSEIRSMKDVISKNTVNVHNFLDPQDPLSNVKY